MGAAAKRTGGDGQPEIVWDEFLAALRTERAGDGAGWVTSREIAKATNRSTKWVRERLAEAIEAGKVAVGRRPATAIDGKGTMVPAYRVSDGC